MEVVIVLLAVTLVAVAWAVGKAKQNKDADPVEHWEPPKEMHIEVKHTEAPTVAEVTAENKAQAVEQAKKAPAKKTAAKKPAAAKKAPAKKKST